MLLYEGEKLIDYMNHNLEIKQSWNERNFVHGVRNYLDSTTEKILAISGLRGTGKTVGILQAAKDYDVVYVLAQKWDNKTGKDYIDFLRNTDKKIIVIDEYSWIDDREELDRYLLTSVQNGKRIVLTATESITLDFLNYGVLNHRVHSLHTTMFTYAEYLKLYNEEHSKAICKKFLMKGGLFEEYALENFDSMTAYIDEAIVKNLAAYLKKEITEETARTLTYSVLYKAVCPSNLSTVPTLRNSKVSLDNFLEQMGVNVVMEIRENDLNRVADIFEHIGLIVRVPNFVKNSSISEQYYITNPSLTCQLILSAYNLRNIDNFILGHVFESCVMVQLAANKLEEHNIYFFNDESKAPSEVNKELDIVITDRKEEYAYFFECKFSQNDEVNSGITLLSGVLEKNYFYDYEIEGRYVIYNGEPKVKKYDVGVTVFTPIGAMMDQYFEFPENVYSIEPDIFETQEIIRQQDFDLDENDILEMAVEVRDHMKETGNTLEDAIEEVKDNYIQTGRSR